MANAASDVFDFIVAQGLTTGGWSILMRKIMDDSDQLIVVQEDGGTVEMPASAGIGSQVMADKGVLVTVRAKESESDVSFAKANAILVALHGLRGVELVSGGDTYLGIRALTPEPVFAGFDDRGRPLHTVALRLLTDAANL